MELELKHIIPYLPYGLKIDAMFYDEIEPLTVSYVTDTLDAIVKPGGNVGAYSIPIIQEYDLYKAKPILKPLSHLKSDKQFIHKFGGDNPNNLRMCNLDIDDLVNNGLEFETYYGYYEWLIENHYDVFRLIEKGLAISY